MRFVPGWRAFGALSLILIGTSACARQSSAHLPATPRAGATETGIASWYGAPYHGRRSASGEIFDTETMTAAHRTLSFGTWVRVENLDNGKRTEVRIIDRGPFVKNRVIDLSHAAARSIDMLGPGTARVKLTVTRVPSSNAISKTEASASTQDRTGSSKEIFFGVQVGAFPDRSRANHLRRDLEVRFGSASTVRRDGTPAVWRVIVGRNQSVEAAEELSSRIRQEFPSAVVVRVD